MLEKIWNLFTSDGGHGNGSGGEPPQDGPPEMIPCEEALERLFEYLDGELQAQTEEKVARHFEICQRCYPRLNFEKAFREALQRARRGEHAPEHVKQRVRELLNEEGLDAT